MKNETKFVHLMTTVNFIFRFGKKTRITIWWFLVVRVNSLGISSSSYTIRWFSFLLSTRGNNNRLMIVMNFFLFLLFFFFLSVKTGFYFFLLSPDHKFKFCFGCCFWWLFEKKMTFFPLVFCFGFCFFSDFFRFFHCIAFHSSMSFQFDCQYIGIYGSSNRTKKKSGNFDIRTYTQWQWYVLVATKDFQFYQFNPVQSINF